MLLFVIQGSEGTTSTFDGVEEDDGTKDHVWRRHDLAEDPSACAENNPKEPYLPILAGPGEDRIGCYGCAERSEDEIKMGLVDAGAVLN